MGMYIQIDSSKMEMLASNAGWADTVKWSSQLPTDGFEEFHHLISYGWSDEPELLRKQTIEASKLAKGLIPEILDDLVRQLKYASVVVSVTNGVGPDDKDKKSYSDLILR